MTAVNCYDVVLEHGVCRIDIFEEPWPFGGTHFAARPSLVRSDGTREPIHAENHEPAEVHGETEAAALNAALAWLDERMGPLCVYPSGCLPDAAPGSRPESSTRR